MFYIAICDDELKTAEILKKAVLEYLESNRETAEIEIYSKSFSLLCDIQEGKHFDLIMSDIEMPEVHGMELAKFIKKYLPESYLIFVTSYIKYAIDAYELSVFRYIPKEQISEKLNRALKDVFRLLHLQEKKFYYITLPMRIEKLPYRSISYIQKEQKDVVLHLMNGKKVKSGKAWYR